MKLSMRAELKHLAVDPRVDEAVAALREVHRRNIHYRMRVGWDPYPNHIGHAGDGGCFRCHTPDLIDDDGRAISSNCTLCHSFFAYDSATPYEILQSSTSSGRERPLQSHLREELLRTPPAAGAR